MTELERLDFQRCQSGFKIAGSADEIDESTGALSDLTVALLGFHALN
jgi:hypothetical protein